MNRRSIAWFLAIILILVIAFPISAVAQQVENTNKTAIDTAKLQKEFKNIGEEALKNHAFDSSSDEVQLYAPPDTSGQVSPNSLDGWGYGRSEVGESFDWAFVMGYSATYANQSMPYVAVESWEYKGSTLINNDDDYEVYDDSVTYFHPEQLKGSVGTTWKVNGTHWIHNGLAGVTGTTTKSWTVD